MNEVNGSTDAAATSLWVESLLWASEYFNRSASAPNDGCLSPHEIFYGNCPPSLLLPFFQPAYHRVPRQHFSRDVTWHHPEAPLIPPATAVGSPPTAPPGDIYVPMPAPMSSIAAPAPAPVPPAPTPAPSPTPVPAPAPTPAPPTPPLPIPMSNSPAQIPPRVSRELAHERYVEVPGRTRGETRAMRDASREYARRHGMSLDHAALV